MARLRRLLPALVLAVLVTAPAAHAVALPRPASDATIVTDHFIVHYYTDPTLASYSTATQAGDIAAYAERALALETGWGYKSPADDGDGKVDIYLDDLSGSPGLIGETEPDGASPYPSPDSAAIVLSTPTQMQSYAESEGLSLAQEEEKTVAHELFHVLQFATWVPNNQSDDWILEGSAQWAGLEMIGFPTGSLVSNLGPADISLDCRDPIAGHAECDSNSYIEGGYSRWGFFQLLANKYGMSFVQNALADSAGGESAIDGLSTALSAAGGSLQDMFTDYANALMDGGFNVPAIAAVRPTEYATVATGVTSATLPVTKVPVNHLAVRYVTFTRGGGDPTALCYQATLNLSVALPPNTDSRPYFFWDVAGSTPVPLSVNGNTATGSIPWDTCNWSASTKGWLSLPNASTDVDAADFVVSASLSVDTSEPETQSPPPTPVSVTGPIVQVPTTEVAPSIQVFGPALLTLSPTDRVIRLIVQSDSEGTLDAALGTTTLGTASLRPGENDVRFTLSKSLFLTLRRSAAASNVLTLTPLSTSGILRGQAVTRLVSIQPAAKPEAKPKRKAKR